MAAATAAWGGRGCLTEAGGGAISGNDGQSTPTPKGDDSPEACKAGWRRRCGYHGEAAGSSHSSQAPKHWSRPAPPRVAAASPAARRMRPLCRATAQAQREARPWDQCGAPRDQCGAPWSGAWRPARPISAGVARAWRPGHRPRGDGN